MSSLTESIPILGYTPNYSSLEQILRADIRSYNVLSAIDAEKTKLVAKQATDPRSDLFSLGTTLYHLISGSSPNEATTRAASVWAGQPDPLASASDLNSQVPLAVAEVLSERRPAAR